MSTPALAGLAARGVQFTDVLSSSNITLPSHAALFTGLTPVETGVDDNQTTLAAGAPTLAEAFRAAGFATVGITSVNLLSAPRAGLGQGFERFSEVAETRSATESAAVLDAWLPDFEGRPLFCWLHVFDAHGPYEPPRELLAETWDLARDPFDPALPEPASDAGVPAYLPGLRDLDFVRALYRGEIAAVDRALAQVIEAPRFARGIVAFTADHGEGHGEHDIWWTHKELYPEMLAVPLVLAWPGAPRGEQRTDPVRQIDVGRTLLDLAGLAETPFPGRHLLAARGEFPRFALAGYGESISATFEGWLLVRHEQTHERGAHAERVESGRLELYDLASDPEAQIDRARSDAQRAAEMVEHLDRWLATTEHDAFRGARRTDAATLAELARLGYVEAAGEQAGEVGEAEDGDE